jgi:Coenzyme PQQ synthesis protein D (PqqD)
MATAVNPDRPRPTLGLVECPVQDELLLYNPMNERVVALNLSARAIWALCDGRHSAAEVSATLSEGLGLPPDALERDVGRAISELRDAGFLEPHGV